MTSAAASLVAELDHIRKVYGSGDTAVTALDDLCMTVRRGEYLAVMGTSGSGKSTAMNILGCLDRPSSGSYRLNGTAVENLSDDQLADLRNRELGFVFQQFHLLQELSARGAPDRRSPYAVRRSPGRRSADQQGDDR